MKVIDPEELVAEGLEVLLSVEREIGHIHAEFFDSLASQPVYDWLSRRLQLAGVSSSYVTIALELDRKYFEDLQQLINNCTKLEEYAVAMLVKPDFEITKRNLKHASGLRDLDRLDGVRHAKNTYVRAFKRLTIQLIEVRWRSRDPASN